MLNSRWLDLLARSCAGQSGVALRVGDESLAGDEVFAIAQESAREIARCVQPGGAVAIEMGANPSALAVLIGAMSASSTVLLVPSGEVLARTSVSLGSRILKRSAWSGDSEVRKASIPDDDALLMDGPRVVFFTAGTTGRPKAVVHSDSSLLRGIWSTIGVQQEASGLEVLVPPADNHLDEAIGKAFTTGRDRGLAFLSGMPWWSIAGFSLGMRSLFTSATLVVPETIDGSSILDAIEMFSVSNIGLSPYLAQLILRSQKKRQQTVPSVIHIGLGAGPVPKGLAAELEDLVGGIVSIGYGMTETAGVAVMGRIHDEKAVRHESIGHAVPGVSTAVISADGTVSTRSATGELIVATDSLLLGYLDGGQRNPLMEFGGERWLRTGDRAKIGEDGNITLDGRLSELIIRGGRNIDPVAVEHALTSISGVTEAFVFGLPGRIAGEQEVCAVIEESVDLDLALIRRQCARTIGVHAVPSRIRLAVDLPRTADGSLRRADARAAYAHLFDATLNGKVDRHNSA
jgi:acyl-CoA synthetase (AMP-forming)/AMP-acid ligase II